jgi:hypothetical protein
MKKRILTLSITFLIIWLSCFLFQMYGFAKGVIQDAKTTLSYLEKNTAIYFIDLPKGIDTITFKATITLDSTKFIHKIKLPNGGTETTVFIYDSSYLELLQNNKSDKVNYLVEGNFHHDQEILLDITLLRPGKYYIHYLSCNLGGIFPLTIQY